MEEIFIKAQYIEDEDLRKEFGNKDLISINEILDVASEFIYENKILEEKIRDLKKEIQEDYKPIDKYDYLGISREDFF